MAVAPQVFPHTAISTWSGFVYQGKLALYHCLKMMSSDYEANRDLKLQLESQDDFAIFRHQQCLSMHQVKAYKDTRFSAYSDGITTQRDNARQRGTPLAYFHVAREVTNIPATFEADYVPVRFYTYPIPLDVDGNVTQSFCPLNQVDIFIQNELSSLLVNVAGQPAWKNFIVANIQNTLEAIVNSKVIITHSKIHESARHQAAIAASEFIEFSELYGVIEADDYAPFENEAFFLSRLQIDIGTYYQEFCERQDGLSQAACQKLDDYLAAITALDAEGMKAFLRATMPHKKGRFNTLGEFKDQSLDRDAMRLGMFTIFWKLVQAACNEGSGVAFSWLSDGIFYYPTGIHHAAEHQESICHDIMQQAISEGVECLFECGALITSAIGRPSISDVLVGIDATEGVDTAEHELLRENRIGNYKKVAMVSLINVPESLKDAEPD
ncbi:ABC-three component system protein [Edaphovirga cremea]|uniref:ABC-three component system protein n=1 Tax=Edaphovirga cremea TaxID=2267246 RepID=UPI000DEFE710|nr:ABC-three component system protein [Edaphovirga cremea]